MLPYHWPKGLLLSKGGLGIFNMRNDLFFIFLCAMISVYATHMEVGQALNDGPKKSLNLPRLAVQPTPAAFNSLDYIIYSTC